MTTGTVSKAPSSSSPCRQWLWLLCSCGIISVSSSFPIVVHHEHRRTTTTTGSTTARRQYWHSAQKSNNNNDEEIMKQAAININEFSRTVPPSRILKYRSPNNMVSIHIEANEAERYHLAERFDLSDIAHLAADLTLMRHGSSSSSSNGQNALIQVEGTCYTKVKQRCVRTNENFDVTMEFPLLCVVKPVVPMLQPKQPSRPNKNDDDDDDISSSSSSKGGSSSNNNNGNKKKKRSGGGNNRGKFDEMAMLELEKLLQQTDLIDEDILMEDEAIYAVNGLLDVGELVAQMFWLSLDPYPKKPGTAPVNISITG